MPEHNESKKKTAKRELVKAAASYQFHKVLVDLSPRPLMA